MTDSTLHNIYPNLVLTQQTILPPVADTTALSKVNTSIIQVGCVIPVSDIGDGTPGLYFWDGSEFIQQAGASAQPETTSIAAYSNKWTSAVTVFKLSASMGYMKGAFTSAANTNTDPCGVLPVGYRFGGVRPVATVVSSSSAIHAASVSSNNLTVSGVTFGTGDIVYTEFAFFITG